MARAAGTGLPAIAHGARRGAVRAAAKAQRAAAPVLPGYSLFGESAHLPDPLHCETLAARSALHDWELSPHRHARLHQLVFVATGGGQALLEGATLTLAPMTLVNVAPGDVHGFSFAPGTGGFVTTLAEEMRDEALGHHAAAAETRRLLARSAQLPADAALAAVMRQLCEEFDGRAPHRALVLRGLATTLLGLVARAAASAQPAAAVPRSPSRFLQRFDALVDAHYGEHWRVADYAQALGITATHLSRLVREATGAPASKVIETRLIREARRHLVYTQASVSAVAYSLGFADPAHFSRVFSKAVGMAPREFRARAAA
ncbi:MAG: helix-turn-helix domain-containing protein [Rubrivivax sp.]|nr:helix-turn-helix domain-containing protein [Rubrivivax sp.]